MRKCCIIMSGVFTPLSEKTTDKKSAKITKKSIKNSVSTGFHSKKSLRKPQKGYFFMQNC